MNKVLWLICVLFLLYESSYASIDSKPEPIKSLVETLLEEGKIIQYGACKLNLNARKVFICFFMVYKETEYVLAVDMNEKKEMDIQYVLKAINPNSYNLVWKKYGIEEPGKESTPPKTTRSI